MILAWNCQLIFTGIEIGAENNSSRLEILDFELFFMRNFVEHPSFYQTFHMISQGLFSSNREHFGNFHYLLCLSMKVLVNPKPRQQRFLRVLLQILRNRQRKNRSKALVLVQSDIWPIP